MKEALEQLAQWGIQLRPEVAASELNLADTYLPQLGLPARLLLRLGQCVEKPPYELFSYNVLRQDAECVCKVETYLRLAERLVRMAGDNLPLEQITSEVDFGARTAWISFLLDGHSIRWELEYNDDWLDPCFFSQLSLLMVKRGAPARLYRPKLRLGQEEVLVCLTPDQKAGLEELTGLTFQPIA